jgi:hypothetical protein
MCMGDVCAIDIDILVQDTNCLLWHIGIHYAHIILYFFLFCFCRLRKRHFRYHTVIIHIVLTILTF